MQSWKQSGMGLEQLIDEYINQKKSLTKICEEHNLNSTTELADMLRGAGYNIRDKYEESARKRKITKDNMEKRWGIGWDELVEWYKARKPLTALCAKHGLSPIGKTTKLNQILADEGILTDDPLRGFGFDEKELLRMYVDGEMSVLAIRRKYNLSRNAGTVISEVLRELGVSRYNLRSNGNRSVRSDGYVRVAITQDNKHLTNIKRGNEEMEHRLVVAASIGRPLKRNEWVHHINRDTTDNRLSNLMLVDKDNHRRIHTSMNAVIEELFREGRAALSEDNEYKLVESDDYNRGFADGIESMLELE